MKMKRAMFTVAGAACNSRLHKLNNLSLKQQNDAIRRQRCRDSINSVGSPLVRVTSISEFIAVFTCLNDFLCPPPSALCSASLLDHSQCKIQTYCTIALGLSSALRRQNCKNTFIFS